MFGTLFWTLFALWCLASIAAIAAHHHAVRLRATSARLHLVDMWKHASMGFAALVAFPFVLIGATLFASYLTREQPGAMLPVGLWIAIAITAIIVLRYGWLWRTSRMCHQARLRVVN